MHRNVINIVAEPIDLSIQMKFWYFSKPFCGGMAETAKEEMRGGLTVR